MKKGISFRNAIFVFCEGETEEQYFECLKFKFRLPIHTLTIGEVNVSNLNRQVKKVWNHLKITHLINKRDIKKYKMKVYYIVDIDKFESKQDVIKIQKKFKEEGIDILFSNGNIELFILEHYVYYNRENQNYIDEIKKYEENYVKGKNSITKRIFGNIIDNNLDTMKKNLRKLKKFHASNGKSHIYDMNPYSETIDLIEYIKKISEDEKS